MTLDELLKIDIPFHMAEDLAATGDPDFILDMVLQYEGADEQGKADMAAFHESGGVGMVEDAAERMEDKNL